jgi:hypothetical protein
MTAPACLICHVAITGDRLCPWCRALSGGGVWRVLGQRVAGSADNMQMAGRCANTPRPTHFLVLAERG